MKMDELAAAIREKKNFIAIVDENSTLQIKRVVWCEEDDAIIIEAETVLTTKKELAI